MTRLANVEKAGYYPLPKTVTHRILSHIAAPNGGRVLDPCAGEGTALMQIATQLKLEPYGVELHQDRTDAANQKITQLLATRTNPEILAQRILQDDYQNLKTPKNAFNLLYENPPYLFVDNKLDGRAEYQWLRNTRPFLQPDGLLVWVVPQHMLIHRKAARYLVAWFYDLSVYRFPDPEYQRFKQVIVFGRRHKKATIPDKKRIARLHELAEQGSRLKAIQEVETPQYALPALAVARNKFTFHGLFIDPQVAIAEAKAVGVVSSLEYQQHLSPTQTQTLFTPLTPMKIGHLTSVIAAGFLNNKAIEQNGVRLLIKGLSYKEKRATKTVEQRGEATVEKTVNTDTIVTRITTLDEQGNLEQWQGDQLQTFLSHWIDQLTAQVAADYQPKYKFDLNGYGKVLSQLNLGRTIPLVGIPGLLPAQKHAAAAAATRLETHRDAIIVGEMGTGKTLMAPATAAALRSKNFPMNHIVVLCPPHLVAKWKREIKIVWPIAKVAILSSITDVNRFFASAGPIFGILKETTARAGSGWAHAFNYCGPATAARRHPRQAITLSHQSPRVSPFTSLKKTNPLFGHYQAWRGIRCPSCGARVEEDDTPVGLVGFKTNRRRCVICSQPLYQDERQNGKAKYPLATYIKKHYKNQLDLLIADECHQFKGIDSDRGYAFHRLATAAKRVLGLTGTIYGGKASSLFHLLYRMSSAVRHSFTNFNGKGKRRIRLTDWVSQYGILQEVETLTYNNSGAQSGNRKSKVRVKELPGGSPAMLPWLLNSAVFVSLSDMGYALPEYEEIPIAVTMTPRMSKMYHAFQRQLKETLSKRLIRKDKSLLGAYLQALLSWPDSPWRSKTVIDKKGKIIASIEALADKQLYPKEAAIIEQILEEKSCGRRVLLLCQQTNTLDITPQWVKMLNQAGIKAAVLKVDPGKREAWVQKQVSHGVDVIITHPKRVETGLDLLDFPTIIWMGTEYSVYTVLQASRRSWRIGQTRPVRVYFFVYENTLQAEALKLIAAKVGATLRINGDTIPDDSLAEMDELAATDLVTALVNIVAGSQGNGAIPNLQEAFSQANDDLTQANTMIGDYKLGDEVDKVPGRYTQIGKVRISSSGSWHNAVLLLVQDDWHNDCIQWPDKTYQPVGFVDLKWERVPDNTPLTPSKLGGWYELVHQANDQRNGQQVHQVSIQELMESVNLETNTARQEESKTTVTKRLTFGISKPTRQRRRNQKETSVHQLSLFD